jgi:DNA-binding NarL/FixJ family response regulator
MMVPTPAPVSAEPLRESAAERIIDVLIADDHELVRSGIRHALERTGTMRVAAEAASGSEAISILARTPVDIVLLDVRMPGMDGLACLDEIVGRWPGIPVLMLSMDENPRTAQDAIARGAAGYMKKTIHPDALASTVRGLVEGTIVTRGAQPSKDGARPDFFGLTDRELDVLRLVAQGADNRSIAAKLFVTVKTVKYHITNIFAKLGVSNRTEAAGFAIRHGIGE